MNDKTSNQVKKIPNPSGKGGFQERPEDINRDGHWNPEMVFSYQYKKFINMDIEIFKNWKEANPQRTMVQELAWGAVFKARTEHKYLQEVTNRTDGLVKQVIENLSPTDNSVIKLLEDIYKDDEGQSETDPTVQDK